eukprot:g5842.t1
MRAVQINCVVCCNACSGKDNLQVGNRKRGIQLKEQAWISEERALIDKLYSNTTDKPLRLSKLSGYSWYSRVSKHEAKLIPPGSRLLWLGSGPFPWTCIMFSSHYDINVTGVDISPQAIEHANYAVQNIDPSLTPSKLRFVLGDATNITSAFLRGYQYVEVACGVGGSVEMKRDALLAVVRAMHPGQVLLVRFYPRSTHVINSEAIFAAHRDLFPILLCGRFKATDSMYILKAVRRPDTTEDKEVIENDGPGIQSCFEQERERSLWHDHPFQGLELSMYIGKDGESVYRLPRACQACKPLDRRVIV